jgi:phenylacetic acid degradation operon negative regulatory protein
VDKICNVEVELPTAPDLILDLLLADGGALTADALCRAGALMGMGESAIRVGLTRLVAAGKVVREERGSYAIHDRPALSRAVDGWQDRHARVIAWRGDWLAVHDATVARSDKTAWRRHSLALALRGFATLKPALQVRPNNLAGGLAAERDRLAALGLSREALTFRLVDLDPADQVAAGALWDVGDLAHRYRHLHAGLVWSSKRMRSQEPGAAARESLLLGRAVIAQLLRDPMLPPELMSPRGRSVLLRKMKAYQRDARDLWRNWLAAREPAG